MLLHLVLVANEAQNTTVKRAILLQFYMDKPLSRKFKLSERVWLHQLFGQRAVVKQLKKAELWLHASPRRPTVHKIMRDRDKSNVLAD